MKLKAKKILNNLKAYTSTNVLFISFVLSSVINASLLRFLTVKNYTDIRPILADLSIAIIIGAFGYFLKPKKQFIYFFIWSLIASFLCFAKALYYQNYISFISISLLSTLGQLGSVSDAVIENIFELKDLIFWWQPITLLIINYFLKRQHYFAKVEKVEKGKINALNTLVAGLICGGIFVSLLTSVDITRLYKEWNRESILMRFGLYVYTINDAISSLKPTVSPMFGYDEASKEFREFYEAKENETNVVKVNEYTNYLKDKNIIIIHAESMQSFLLNKTINGQEITPNLNKLASEGLSFSNFYSQTSAGTSSDTEFTLNTGLLPASSGTVFISYFDRTYVALPQLLTDTGYYTFSMHGNNGTYWNRNVMHERLGFQQFFYYTKDYDIDEVIGLGLSDKSFFRQSVTKIKDIAANYDKYYGLLIMLTNHTPFTDVTNLGYADIDVTMTYNQVTDDGTETLTANYLEGTELGNYIKSAHYADEAIGELITELDNEGLLDDTAIIIYGDHDAKIKYSEYLRYYNYDPTTDGLLSTDDPNYYAFDEYDYELNRSVPFIIWMKNQTKTQTVTKVMGMYDVFPTLCNMLGLEQKYAIGHDIFSINDNVVVFPNGNWMTDKVYYNSQKQEFKVLDTSSAITEDYIQTYTEYATTAVSVSNDIIVYDLIKKTEEAEAFKEEYRIGE